MATRCGGEATGDAVKEVVLIFKKKGLLYDIRNYCFIEGHIMETDNIELRHTLQDVGEEGNEDRVTRMLSLAHSDIVERLYPFTKREIDREVMDNRLRDKRVYGIALQLPEWFSQTTVNLLKKLIHELLVDIVVADWLSITNTEKSAVWREKVENIYRRIGVLMTNRRQRVRIRPRWL